MAQMVSITAAALNENPFRTTQTVVLSTEDIAVESIPSTNFGGVACVTKVTVGSTLPSPSQQRYYTSATAASILAAANAALITP